MGGPQHDLWGGGFWGGDLRKILHMKLGGNLRGTWSKTEAKSQRTHLGASRQTLHVVEGSGD